MYKKDLLLKFEILKLLKENIGVCIAENHKYYDYINFLILLTNDNNWNNITEWNESGPWKSYGKFVPQFINFICDPDSHGGEILIYDDSTNTIYDKLNKVKNDFLEGVDRNDLLAKTKKINELSAGFKTKFINLVEPDNIIIEAVNKNKNQKLKLFFKYIKSTVKNTNILGSPTKGVHDEMKWALYDFVLNDTVYPTSQTTSPETQPNVPRQSHTVESNNSKNDASMPDVPLETSSPLLQTSEWEVRWAGKTRYPRREDPLEMKLKRQASRIEGVVVRRFSTGAIPPLMDEVRGSIAPDGSLTLMSEGHLQWRGKLSEDNRIAGVFPNGPSDDARFFMPFTVVAVERLKQGTVKTKMNDGSPTTNDWNTFLVAFRGAITNRDKVALRPFIASKFELANEGRERYYPPDRVLKRLDGEQEWRELNNALHREIQARPPSAWGHPRMAAIDNSPCTGCKHEVWLVFERDEAHQWHWISWIYPGD